MIEDANKYVFAEDNELFLKENGDQIKYYTKRAMEVMGDFDVGYTDYSSVELNIKAWFNNKSDLFCVLRKHPNWNERLKSVIIQKCVEEETINKNDICSMNNRLQRNVLEHIYKTFSSIANPVWENIGYYLVRTGDFNRLLSQEDVSVLNSFSIDGLNFKTGTKRSRALNYYYSNVVLCDGSVVDATKFTNMSSVIDGSPVSYDKSFAEIADALNPHKIEKTAILSCNFLDYLTMSNGNSWKSCHLPPDGCYCGGTLSYANDESSMIFYTLPKDVDITKALYSERKITREVFCYNKGSLMQSRLYPQTHNTDLMETYRNNVQHIFSVAEGVPNLWKTMRSYDSFPNI